MADSSGNIRRALERLGLSGNPSLDEIRAAYHRRAMETHPDRGGDQEEFLKVKHAYEYLTKNYASGEEAYVEQEARPEDKEVVPYRPQKRRFLPAPEERKMLPAPEERKMLPAPEERKALPPPEEGKNLPVPYTGGPPALQQKPKAILGTRKSIKVRLPHLGRHNDIVWSLVLIIIGMTIAALIGSMWIFFAFVCLAGYIIVPDEDEIIGGELRKIKEKYIKRIENATSDQQRQAIEKDLEETLKNQRTVERIKTGMGLKYTSATAKHLIKFGFFALFSLGFITSSIPLAKPVGIFLAFAGYYMEGT